MLRGAGMAKPAYDFIDATFAFFQAIARRPGGAAWISLWHLALYAGLTVLVLALVAPFFAMAVSAAADGREPSAAELLSAGSGLVAGITVSVLGFLLAALIVQGAWLRLLARDEVAAIIPLRFGADEVRLLGVNLVFIGFNLVGWTAVVIVFAAVNAGVFAASGAGEPGAGVLITGGLINLGLALFVGAAAIILMIRFAAAPGLSVRERAFKLFDSIPATKAITAWMALSYLTIIIGYMVGSVMVWALQQVIILLAASDLIATVSALENTQDPELVLRLLGEALLQPAVLGAFAVVIVLQMVLQIVFEGSWHGVGVYAARREAGDIKTESDQAPAASVGAAPHQG